MSNIETITLKYNPFQAERGDRGEIVVAFSRKPFWFERVLIYLRLMQPLQPDELRVRLNRVNWWHAKSGNNLDVRSVHIIEYRW